MASTRVSNLPRHPSPAMARNRYVSRGILGLGLTMLIAYGISLKWYFEYRCDSAAFEFHNGRISYIRLRQQRPDLGLSPEHANENSRWTIRAFEFSKWDIVNGLRLPRVTRGILYRNATGWAIGDQYTLQLWMALLLILIPGVYLWWPRRKPPDHCCQTCGYNLTGNKSGTCPECGLPIPNNLEPAQTTSDAKTLRGHGTETGKGAER